MDYSLISEVGNREHNEDSAAFSVKSINGSEFGLFIVADGLGGHGRGEVASQLVVAESKQIFENRYDMTRICEDILDSSQNKLLEKQKAEHAFNEMKTTAVLLSVTGNSAYWVHVGDSRLYFFRRNKMVLHTKDHSIPQMLVTAGEIKEKKIRRHPDRNKLLRVMGTDWEEPQYTVSEAIELAKGDAFLLCSDGFWENVTEKQMEKCLKKSDGSAEWLDKMKLIAEKTGRKTDMDNYTALAVII